MGIKSGGYNATLPEQKPFKYWALLAAIRRVMEDVPYPDVMDVMDALLEPGPNVQTAMDGKTIRPRHPDVKRGKPSKPTLNQLQTQQSERQQPGLTKSPR
jgi:hypothetical protein